jgi:hypothetical protein
MAGLPTLTEKAIGSYLNGAVDCLVGLQPVQPRSSISSTRLPRPHGMGSPNRRGSHAAIMMRKNTDAELRIQNPKLRTPNHRTANSER